jgi:hypothetical protein
VSEIDPADVSSRGLRAMQERFRKETTEPGAVVAERPGTGEREGLPPGYRMRADAHYVDQLTSRTPDMTIRSVAVDQIDAAGSIDMASIEPLTRSIATHGVLQPLLVRRDETGYRIIAGRKRLLAAREAGLATVPCVVHYVDENNAEQLAQAVNLRVGSVDAGAASGSLTSSGITAGLTDNLSAIESALSLLGNRGLSTSRRVAVDVIRSEAWRASWLLKAEAVGAGQARGDGKLRLLGSMLERVREGFRPESRLSSVELQVVVPDWNVSAVVDEECLVTGLTGAVVATLGLVEDAAGAEVTLIATSSLGGSLGIDVAQDVTTISPEIVSRFFDPAWTDRPGGRSALLGALSAKAAAQQHGGDAIFLARDRRGSTLRLTLDQSR